MLKILKIQINLEVKGDPQDLDDLRDRLYENLQVAIEENDLDFEILEDEDADEGYNED